MFIDAREVPDGIRIEADICIIGGGAAGITLAHEFSGQPFRVCLLESGGFRLEKETQRLYEGEIVGIPYDLETTRSRFLGGGTNCWAGFNRPFEEYHFETRDWVADSGWPISRADLEPYYVRAHVVCGIRSDGYDPEVELRTLKGHHLQPLPLAGTRTLTRLCQLSKSRRRFGKVFRGELRHMHNVAIYLHANAVELERSSDGNLIDGLCVATPGRKPVAGARPVLRPGDRRDRKRTSAARLQLQRSGRHW
jgi:hypothetical protein